MLFENDGRDLPEISTAALLSTQRVNLPSALRNVFSNWAGFLAASLISFFLSPYVVHHLGNSAYGIWIIAGSVTGYLGLLNLGVRAAVTRYVARFHVESKDQEASSIVSSAIVIFLIAGFVAILISFSFAAVSTRLFHVSESYQSAARAVVVLAGFNVAVSLISGVFSGILAALHRFDLINLIEAVNSALSAIAIVLLLSAGKGLIALSVINLGFAVAVGLTYAWVASVLYPGLKIRLSSCDKQHLKVIFSFSFYSFLLQISFNLIFYTDSMVIGSFLSVGLITFFAIAGNLINYSRSMISGISTTMTPRVSALAARGARDEVQGLLIKGTRLATVMILPIAVTFLFRGRSFIRLWMGQDYADTSGQLLQVLTVALIFVAAEQVMASIVGGIDKYRPVVLVVSCEAICNLLLSVVLARRMGLVGVAWGTTLPSLAVSLIFWPRYVRHVFGISIRRYIASTWVRPVGAIIPFAFLTYEIEKVWPAPNLLVFFSQTGAILPTVALAAWFLCLDHSERARYAREFVPPFLKTIRGR